MILSNALRYLRGHWQLVALTLLIFAHWHTQVILPFKILVVFLHEFSHALATWLTGGTVDAIALDDGQGGLTLARGGNSFAIASAGYLGSLVLGLAIFLAAVRTRADRIVMAVLGGVVLVTTAFYFQGGFAILYGSLSAAAMLASAAFLGRHANDLLLRVIGVTSMMYAPYDIFQDTIAHSGLRSDARILAESYGGSTLAWGGLWFLLSLVILGLAARLGLGETSNLPLRFLDSPEKAG